MTFRLDSDKKGLINLSGEVSVNESPQLLAQAEKLISQMGAKEIVVNLRDLNNAHSAILSVLLGMVRYANSQKKLLFFIEIPTRLFDLSRVSGLDKVLPYRS
jgi:anti-anti-sigma factor